MAQATFESQSQSQPVNPGVIDHFDPIFQPVEPSSKPDTTKDSIKDNSDQSSLANSRFSAVTANSVGEANKLSMASAQNTVNDLFGNLSIDMGNGNTSAAAKTGNMGKVADDYNPDDYAPAQNSTNPDWDPSNNPLQEQLELDTLTAPPTIG